MTADDRLERLERRLAALEAIVRKLTREPPASVTSTQKPARGAPPSGTPPSGTLPSPDTLPPAGTPSQPPLAPPPAPPRFHLPEIRDAEQWVGQRGLLAVGVVLVTLATAYLLKLAFDREWVSPAVRCAGGATVGIAVGVLGWRLYHRPLRTYGAALIGTGAGMVYLALWAASSLYSLMPAWVAIAALVVTSLSLSGVAYRLNVEALGAAAALGAFLAPVVISSPDADANVLLVYLAVVGATLGYVVTVRQWRIAAAIVAVMYFGVGVPAADDAASALTLAFALFGGTAGLAVALAARWPETRLVSFGGAWALLAIAAANMSAHWPIVAGGVVLAVPVWWRALGSARIWPDDTPGDEAGQWSLGETFYFYATPLFVSATIPDLAPAWFQRHGGAAPLLVSLPYLAVGLSRPAVSFATAAAAGLSLAALGEWPGLEAAWALTAFGVGWAVLHTVLRRPDARWYALASLGLALVHILGNDLARRPAGPGFVDAWAVTVWVFVVVIAMLARRSWESGPLSDKQPDAPAGGDGGVWRAVPAALWAVAGTLVFGVVTNELHRSVIQLALDAGTRRLASGLAISAWWALFAGGLVLLGFRRSLKPVRVAGLVVAGLAVAKVLLFDLSRLDALFRVGSVLTLGVVSLLVAYLYYRMAARSA